MQFSLTFDVCSVFGEIDREERRKRKRRSIDRRIGEVIARQIHFALAAYKCVQRLRVQVESRDAICNIRLKFHGVYRLILDLKLGYLRCEFHARVIDSAAAFCSQIQRADDLNVSRLKRLKLIEADARGLYLAVVGLALREISDIALRGTRRHSHCESASHFVAGTLEIHVRRLYGLIGYYRLAQVDRSLPNRIQLRSVQRDIRCEGACYRSL